MENKLEGEEEMNENSTKCYGVISDILWIFGLMKSHCPAALFLTAVEIIMRAAAVSWHYIIQSGSGYCHR